jgi:hypothetical protein
VPIPCPPGRVSRLFPSIKNAIHVRHDSDDVLAQRGPEPVGGRPGLVLAQDLLEFRSAMLLAWQTRWSKRFG